MTTRTHKRPLNTSQQEVLQILYKFHYATTKLISTYQNKTSPVYTYKRLNSLVEQEYIGRKYDGKDKILDYKP